MLQQLQERLKAARAFIRSPSILSCPLCSSVVPILAKWRMKGRKTPFYSCTWVLVLLGASCDLLGVTTVSCWQRKCTGLMIRLATLLTCVFLGAASA